MVAFLFEIMTAAADVIMNFLLPSEALRETTDGHLIRLTVPKSFCALEHFPEDHWTMAVEMMDRNQNPKFSMKMIVSRKIFIP